MSERITEDEAQEVSTIVPENTESERVEEAESVEDEPTAPPASVTKKKAGRPPSKKNAGKKKSNVTQEEEDDEEEDKVNDKLVTSEEVPTSKQLMDTAVFKQYNDQAKSLEKILNKQPRVMVMVPFLAGEKPGAVHECGINGVFMAIPKGRMMSVPQSIANLLADHFNLTYEVGKDFEMGRRGDVQDALS